MGLQSHSDGPFERDGSVPNSDPTSNLDAGTYSYDATYNGDDGINDPSSGLCAAFTIGQATPSPTPSIANLPTSPTWSSGGGFTATLNATDSDGVQSVTSSTTDVCTASGLTVTYVTAGTCTLTAQTAASTDYVAASGSQQSFTIGPGDTVTHAVHRKPPLEPTWSSGACFTAIAERHGQRRRAVGDLEHHRRLHRQRPHQSPT